MSPALGSSALQCNSNVQGDMHLKALEAAQGQSILHYSVLRPPYFLVSNFV